MRRCQWASLSCGLAFVLSGQMAWPNQNIYRGGTIAAVDVPAPLTVRAIAAGGTHSVVLASDGTVWTWGANSEGQLGYGAAAAPLAPAEVNGLSGVVGISAGYAHTVALKSDGSVWAWGKNREGQLGDGTTIGRAKPVQVRGIGGVVAVAAGNSHSVALKDDGTVWAWGDNLWGQLGDGTTTNRATPAPVPGLTGVAAIAAGQAHSLALKRDGTVWVWGNNMYGQLGDGTFDFMGEGPPSVPAQVGGLAGVTAIAAGYTHSLALKADGTVWMWGPALVQAGGLTNVLAIAAGYSYSLAVKGDGTVWEWGCSAFGQSAPRTYTCRETPAQVTWLAGIEKVALPMGGYHGLALKGDGTAWEWGGFLGATNARSVPSQLGDLSGVVAVSAGLALKSDGTVWGWNAPSNSGWVGGSMPSQVIGLSRVMAIASGSPGYNLALKNDETVWMVLGPSAVYQVPNLTGVVAMAAGESRALAVKRDGTVWEWSGVNSAPVQVSELSGVAAVAEAFEWWSGYDSRFRTLALKCDGTVWAWDGVYSSRSAPVQVSGLTGVTAIAAGEISLALKDDGTVWQWNEAATQRPAPVQVSGLAGITAIAIGGAQATSLVSSDAHALALKADETVWGWGLNANGQLGDGTTTYRAAPVQVGVLSEVAAITAAGFSSAAVKRDGTVWAWGAGGNQFEGAWSLPAQVPALGSPDLAITMSHSGDFVVGDPGAYSLAIANTGRIATAGVITLTDTMPPGLTFVSAVGNGWTCAVAGRIVTCTNPGPIAPGASNIFTLTVRVEPQAYPGVTNIATVSNASDFSTWNNTTGDPAVVAQGR